MKIILNDKDGVVLQTSNKYCTENIEIGVNTTSLNVTPTTSEQTFNGLYDEVVVGPSESGGTDTSDATATPSDLLEGITAYSQGEKIEGTMKNLSGTEVSATNIVQYTVNGLTITANTTNSGYINTETSIVSDVSNETIASAASIVPEKIALGTTIFGVTGNVETLNTEDANAVATDIRADKTAYVKGKKVVGTMPTYGSQTITPTTTNITLDEGYHTNTLVRGDANLLPQNIKKGVTIFSITGTLDNTQSGVDVEVSNDALIWTVEPYVYGSTSVSTPTIGDVHYHYALSTTSTSLSKFTRLSYNPDVEATIPRVGDITIGRDTYTYAGGKRYNIIGVVSSISQTETNTTCYITTYGYFDYAETLATLTADATATASTIFEGKTAYVRGEKVVGTYNAAAAGDTTFYFPSAVSFANSTDTTIDLTGAVTSTITAWNSTFANCYNLTKLNFDSLDTSGATSLSATFFNCRNLNFDNMFTSNVFKVTNKITSTYGMFWGCNSLKTFNFPQTWDMSNVTTMSNMFNYCKNLTDIDISTMNLSSVTNAAIAFGNCSSLRNINFGDNFFTAPNANLGFLFAGSANINFSAFNFKIPNNTSCGYMFGRLSMSSSGNRTLDVSNIDFTGASNVGKIVADSNYVNYVHLNYRYMPYLKSITEICANFTCVKTLDGISELDAPNATSFMRPFSQLNRATSLVELNLCNWNLPNITSLANLFPNFYVQNLDMCNWNTPNVNNTSKMFNNSWRLVNLNVENMSLPLVTNAQSMFNNCLNLSETSLDQIMNLMTVTSLSGSSKTLAYLGLTQNQVNLCVNLPNWTNMEANGWTTGY